jgi:hypothetical protein
MNNNQPRKRRPLRAVSWEVRQEQAQRKAAISAKALEKDAEKEAKALTVQDAVQLYIEELSQSPNGKLNRKAIVHLIEKLGSPPWMSRHTVYNAYLKHRKEKEKENAPVSTVNVQARNSPTATTVSAITAAEGLLSLTGTSADQQEESITKVVHRNQGGRPVGTTTENYTKETTMLEQAKVLSATNLRQAQDEAKSIGRTLANGALTAIIESAVLFVGLPLVAALQISKDTIRHRVQNSNVLGHAGSYSQSTPMGTEVESILVGFCVQLCRMGRPINCSEFLTLANSLILDQPTAKKVVEYKAKICGVISDSPDLGPRYYHSFLGRHGNNVHTTKSRRRDVSRHEWATYENIEKMYNLVYQEMVCAGVAEYLDSPVWCDKEGNDVDNENGAFGKEVDVKITHPDYILFVDETGSNTNMKKDGHRGGTRVIAEKGFNGESLAVTSDIHYTSLGFTAATGEPVMCCIIFPSNNEESIPYNWVSGIDVQAGMNHNHDDVEYIKDNSGTGKHFPGGPVCDFKGKKVPCFIASSPHGGITSAILTDMLRTMDKLELFPRTHGRKPFLLLDGHQSRFEVDFLKYIADPQHPWSVCFGVPYGTHLWQVADSSEQNGTFKIFETEAKDRLLKYKLERRMASTFGPTDIIPILNFAWERSFVKVKSNKKAIAERGWFPCNRSLLLRPDILLTKPASEQEAQTAVEVNTDTGAACHAFDVIFDHKNTEAARLRYRKRQAENNELQKTLDRSKKLTSGKAFKRGMVGLHHPEVLDHQVGNMKYRIAKERSVNSNRNKKLSQRIEKVKKIKEKPQDQWTVADFKTLCTYKKVAKDPPLKAAKDNKQTLLAWWNERKGRQSPVSSPCCSANESFDDIAALDAEYDAPDAEDDDTEDDDGLIHEI